MFYIVGVGLGDVKDITVRGLEIVRGAKRVYLESYTSILPENKIQLEQFYERSLIEADRNLVEQGADEILNNADTEDVVLLVVGDPFGATTHTDILLRAQDLKIETKVIHNASIINAIGCCGLQLYHFGETVSIPFWTDNWKPSSFINKINQNKAIGLHTLCLLDIQVKEPTWESLTKKTKVYQPPRFMEVNQACSQLLQIIDNNEFDGKNYVSRETFCVGAARIGWPDQKIVAGTLAEMVNVDLGPPLHSMVIVGTLHPLEEQFIKQFTIESK
ncbi:Tetrapyrrole methylase, subdomain 1,Tetrapyrrole methylase, subdomain 2,Tetrapyrrole methylase,Diphthine [Cinara cedri]|uniref:diphthine methyl ester synthase n=1 Tax=Cinara cedri TaxID=506608 RepID=A0A5E4ML78_9HEMI|nr:Tetrapyrrole methylase, subdomain 1,Tetrapyrrole methylase, subdomain 2,Tetrapyrrole methylase,Diphthine [Cinara cedri]